MQSLEEIAANLYEKLEYHVEYSPDGAMLGDCVDRSTFIPLVVQALSDFGAACAAAERDKIRALLEAVADYLYNPFEPENQSSMYQRVRAALE